MPIDLYYLPGSSPSIAIILTAKILDLELNLKVLNMIENEHLKPEFLEINPMHTVPTMVDNKLVLSESRAIMTYLVNKYRKGSSLYPEDPEARALVDQRLYFDLGTLLPRTFYIIGPLILGHPPADEEKLAEVEECLRFLDYFLRDDKYVAGPNLTIADISIAANIYFFENFGGDFKEYPNIVRWYETIKNTVPGYEEITRDGKKAINNNLQMLQNCG